MAFAEKTAEAKVASLKAVEPKLQAFYNSLDEKQKKAFDTGRRVGGILNWLRNKRRANFKQRPGSKEQSRRQCQVPNGFALNPDAVIPKGTGAVELAVGGSPPLYPPPCADKGSRLQSGPRSPKRQRFVARTELLVRLSWQCQCPIGPPGIGAISGKHSADTEPLRL